MSYAEASVLPGFLMERPHMEYTKAYVWELSEHMEK